MPKVVKVLNRAHKDQEPASKEGARSPLPVHEFRLIYPGSLDDLSDADIDTLYEAGCDDATIGSSQGLISIDFSRRAPSFRVALSSAMADVEKAGLGLELMRVEPE